MRYVEESFMKEEREVLLHTFGYHVDACQLKNPGNLEQGETQTNQLLERPPPQKNFSSQASDILLHAKGENSCTILQRTK